MRLGRCGGGGVPRGLPERSECVVASGSGELGGDLGGLPDAEGGRTV